LKEKKIRFEGNLGDYWVVLESGGKSTDLGSKKRYVMPAGELKGPACQRYEGVKRKSRDS